MIYGGFGVQATWLVYLDPVNVDYFETTTAIAQRNFSIRIPCLGNNDWNCIFAGGKLFMGGWFNGPGAPGLKVKLSTASRLKGDPENRCYGKGSKEQLVLREELQKSHLCCE